MNKIRTAILGYGRSGSSLHAGAIEKSDSFEMVAACDTDPKRRQEAASRFGASVHDDYHQMLAEEDLDLVSIVTRSDQHCEMTCDCLAAGVNVLVTKPWAVDEAEARRMVEAHEASGKRLLPWLPARWGCVLRRLQELVRDKAIGDAFLVRHVRTSFATRCDWQTERRYGGGYLLNWGPHVVDAPLQLFECPVVSVYGRMKQTINPGDTEDVFLAIMTLGDGTVVQAEYTVAIEDLPEWFIQGDRGTIVARGRQITVHKRVPVRPDDPTKFGTMKGSDGETREETVEGEVYGDPLEIYSEVAQSICGEREFAVSPSDALQLTRILDAIRVSSDENRVVSL